MTTHPGNAWEIPWTKSRGPKEWSTNEHSTYMRKNVFFFSFLSLQTVIFSQFSSVTQLCLTLCDPHEQKHTRPLCPSPTRRVHPNPCPLSHDAIQPPHPLSSPSPPALSPSQHQGLFKWVNSSHQVAKVLEFQLQHQSFQWITKTDFL